MKNLESGLTPTRAGGLFQNFNLKDGLIMGSIRWEHGFLLIILAQRAEFYVFCTAFIRPTNKNQFQAGGNLFSNRERVLCDSFLPYGIYNKAIPFELWVNDFFRGIVS